MRTGILSLASGLVASSLLLSACKPKDSSTADTTQADSMAAMQAPPATTETPVRAIIRNASNQDLGILTLTDVDGGIMLEGQIKGLPPGVHAIHVHAMGVCEAPFTSAGPHWNPTTRQHGKENPQGQHLGDLLNITVAPDSSVIVGARIEGGTLRGTNALLDADGGAVVVHAKADDYKTDPAGNAGDRIACGVVSGS